MPLIAVALIVVQEMSARLGVITGKGLADLIRESMGVRATALLIGLVLLANLANTISEFAGVAAGMEVFGISKYVSVPLAAALVWVLVVRASYKWVERVFLVASALYLAYFVSGIMAAPPWQEVGRALVTPSFEFEAGYLTLAVTIVGTTIAPWMQFYQQASIVDKGLRITDCRHERLDVILGSVFAVFVAAFITIACAATLFAGGVPIETAKDAALALGPLAGRHAATLFGVGLLNASVFAAAILPLSTAYLVYEAFGWEAGLDRCWREAPVFFGLYTAFIVVGAAVILLPIRSLVQAMMVSQTLNGVLLPVILVVMLRLVNDRGLMGRFANGRLANVVCYGIVAALIALTAVLLLPRCSLGRWASRTGGAGNRHRPPLFSVRAQLTGLAHLECPGAAHARQDQRAGSAVEMHAGRSTPSRMRQPRASTVPSRRSPLQSHALLLFTSPSSVAAQSHR